MLTFRNTNIFFGTIIGCLLILDLWLRIPWYIYLGMSLLYAVILFYGSYNVTSDFFMKVVSSADTNDKLIAITFDDGPAAQYTAQVLQVLKEQKVPAAFFFIGNRIV